MRPVEILSCLGARADDARVQSLLRHYRILREPEAPHDAVSGEIASAQDWLPNLSMGIEFGFEDEASFLGAPPVEWGTGPMLLTETYFYSALQAATSYLGEFPFGLAHGDDKGMVRNRMRQYRAPFRARQRDTWAFQTFDFTVDYSDVDGSFAYAVAILRPTNLPSDTEIVARCPPVADLIAILGRSLGDDLLDTALAKTGYARALQILDPASAMADLTEDLGLQLDFGQVIGVQGIALNRVTLLGDRRFGSRIWPGALPLGLQFGASWQEIVASVGREPDDISETDFLLTAFWRSSAIVIEIEYSTMINTLLAVSLVYSG